jgi:plasmid maintenance system killer protein
VAVEELGKKELQLMEESKEYTRLMVENSNDIRDIKSKLNGLESIRYVTKSDG